MLPRTDLRSHSDALGYWSRRERAVFDDIFRPQPHLRPSAWSDGNRVISQGPRKGERMLSLDTPYLVEILDFIANPWARRGVVRKSARVGYTEYVIGNGVAWTIVMDPCPIAVVQPNDGEAKGYSKEQVQPLVDENDAVRTLLGEMGTRSSDSTLTYKEFPNGFLSILGSASDANMRRRSFRRVFVDEVDGMVIGPKEGDPLLRIQKRTDDYDDGVMLVGSTPTLKHLSRIDNEFENSDQRFWQVPCPRCRKRFVPEWGGADQPFGIKWDKEIFCRACGAEVRTLAECSSCGAKPPEEGAGRIAVSVQHLPETAFCVCPHCRKPIDESKKAAMVRAGRWVATQPGSPIPGWHIDALISLFPGARWGKLVGEFLDAGDDSTKLQVFWNTVLGRAYEEKSKKVEVSELEKRAELYVTSDGGVIQVPDGVGILTAAVDVQHDRLELLVRGWGLEEQSWDILHERIYGDPESQNTWARLEALLSQPYRHERGGLLYVGVTMIDAAYLTDTVYSFVKLRESRQIFASLGDKTGDPKHVEVSRAARANAQGVSVFTIGTYKVKSTLFRRLAIQQPGPRYMHLRKATSGFCNGFDAEYFAQFGAEKHVTRQAKGTLQAKPMYVQIRDRNESIDLHVGNLAAFLWLGAAVRLGMPAYVEAARRVPEAETAAPREPRRKSNWVNRWRS